MNAWNLFGHDWAVEHLRRSIVNGRVRHAYLFTGSDRIGKTALATAFAMTMNCEVWVRQAKRDPRPCGECSTCRRILSGNHPDMTWAQHDPTSGTMKIEDVRRVAGQLALKPFEARYRIAMFTDFDQATPQAQDALLKTLEEPTRHAMLFLTTTDPNAILPTITSRSQVVRLRPVSIEQVRAALIHHGTDETHADLLAHLSGGRIGWALEAAQKPETLDARVQALELLENLIYSNRVKRFAAAEDLSRDKPNLPPLLALWQTYWRDVVLRVNGGGEMPLVNVDRASTIEALSAKLDPNTALEALKATHYVIQLLNETNTQPRLALEAMLLDYPFVA